MNAMVRVSLAHMVQYRGEVLLWAVWGIVFPAVSMAAWRAAAEAPGNNGAIQSFSQPQIAAYFLLTMVVGHLTAAWDVYEMGFLVRTGALSPQLLRPILPLWRGLSDNIAYKVVTMTLLIPFWLAVAWYVQPDMSTSTVFGWLLGIPAVLLAWGIAFVWGYCIATLAFYITKMDAASELYFGLSMFLSGRVAAIEWLPGWLEVLTYFFPFRWAMAFPVELILGRLDRAQIVAGFGWQLFWMAAGVGAFRLVWYRGVQRYSAVGA